jgi:hypothetical protein
MVSDVAIRLARRYVWWQEPAETLADVRHLLRQIMALGRPEDYRTALDLWGRDAFVGALESAPPGAMDDRSWYFWRRHFNLAEVPPPLRCFDDAAP